MFAPAVSGPVPARTTWVVADTRGLAADYWFESDRVQVAELSAAELVSSQVGPDAHAPLLDVDVPAVLGLAPDGGFVLWVDGLGVDGHRVCVDAFVDAGLGAPVSTVEELAGFSVSASTSNRRAGLVGAPGWEVVDVDEMTTLLRAVGPGWDGSWAELQAAAAAAVHTGAPRGVRTCGYDPVGPGALGDPWPVPLTVPATMLRSTHHLHLYVDEVVREEVFFTLLDTLVDPGLVEKGFAVASRHRERAHLRVPWRSKEPAVAAPL